MSEPLTDADQVQLPEGFKLVDDQSGPTDGPQVPAGFRLMRSDGGTLVDLSKPKSDIHAAIAGLPEKQRPLAMRQWADKIVADGGGANTIPQVSPPIIGPLAEKAVAAINAGITKAAHGGEWGQYYDLNRAVQEAQHRADYAAHPTTNTITKVASGVLVPLPGGPATTALGRIGQAATIGGTVAAGDAFVEGDTPNIGDRLEHAAKAGLLGAALGGGLGAAGETYGAVRQAIGNRGKAGAYNEFAKSLPDSDVGTFANQVATGSKRHDLDINRRTLDVLGEEMAANPADRVGAVRRTIDRLVDEAKAESNRIKAEAERLTSKEDADKLLKMAEEVEVSPNAAKARVKRLTDVNRDSQLFLAEAPAAAPGNAEIKSHTDPAKVDIDAARQIADSGTHWHLDTLANNAGQSATNVRNAVAARQADQHQVMRDVLDGLAPKAGSRPMTIEDTPQIIDAARAAARQAYAKAEQNQQPFNDRLEHVLDVWYRSLRGQQSAHADAVRKATDLFRNEVPIAVDPMTGAPTGKAMVTIGAAPANGGTGPLRDFIHRRGQLNDMIDKSLDQFGQPTALTRDLMRMKMHIDNAVGVRNPDWLTANRQFADMKLDQVGQRLGDALSVKPGPQFRAQMREYDGMAPQAKEIVNVHFLQKLKDKIDALGDGHDVAKIFNSGHVREMVTKMFGPQKAIELLKAVRDAQIATRTARMMGGSPTHARGMRAADLDAETGILAAVDQASLKGVRNAALQWAAQRFQEARRRALAEIATTPLNDTAAVAMHIHNMRLAQARARALAQPSGGPQEIAKDIGGAIGYALSESNDRNGWEQRRANAR